MTEAKVHGKDYRLIAARNATSAAMQLTVQFLDLIDGDELVRT
jgi:hypothetical protein